MNMTALQLFELFRHAGFPTSVATSMTAIALRESSGDPNAFNGVGLDRSYGLVQINMIGALGVARKKQFAIGDETDLFNPETNAKAAFILWAHNNANLKLLWAIDRDAPLPYRARYESHLPAAQAAALASPLGITITVHDA